MGMSEERKEEEVKFRMGKTRGKEEKTRERKETEEKGENEEKGGCRV